MMEESGNSTTKDKIIEAALGIIAQEGFQKVTIRKIAVNAGVNVAAVNYHFGSKEKVLNEALEHVMVQIKKIFRCLQDDEKSPEARLGMFVEKYSNILFKYPDPVKNLIHQSIHERSVINNFQEYLRIEGVDLIKKTIRQIRVEEEDFILSMRTAQLLSSMAFPVLLGNRAEEIFGIELQNIDNRRIYADLLVKNILNG